MPVLKSLSFNSRCQDCSIGFCQRSNNDLSLSCSDLKSNGRDLCLMWWMIEMRTFFSSRVNSTIHNENIYACCVIYYILYDYMIHSFRLQQVVGNDRRTCPQIKRYLCFTTINSHTSCTTQAIMIGAMCCIARMETKINHSGLGFLIETLNPILNRLEVSHSVTMPSSSNFRAEDFTRTSICHLIYHTRYFTWGKVTTPGWKKVALWLTQPNQTRLTGTGQHLHIQPTPTMFVNSSDAPSNFLIDGWGNSLSIYSRERLSEGFF